MWDIRILSKVCGVFTIKKCEENKMAFCSVSKKGIVFIGASVVLQRDIRRSLSHFNPTLEKKNTH